MKVPVQILFRDCLHSHAVEARITEQIHKLEKYCDRITSCRVVLQATHRNHQKGKLYQVQIHMTVPGGNIVVGRDTSNDHSSKDVYAAIRDSFEASRRQLKKHVRQIRERYQKKQAHYADDT